MVFHMVSGFRVRLIDTAGSVIGIVSWGSETISEGDMVHLPDGRAVGVYDDEFGQEGAFRPRWPWMTGRRLPRTRERGASFAGRWRLFNHRPQLPNVEGIPKCVSDSAA
jgi:hypothetical protein